MNVTVRGGKIPPKEHKRLLAEDAVNDILERLIFAKPVDVTRVRPDCMFLPHQMGPMWARAPYEHDEMMFFTPEEINSADIVWPVSVGAVWHKNNEEWGRHLECHYIESVPAKKLRGRCKFVGKKNLGHFQGVLEANGKWVSVASYASWHGKWLDAGRIRYDTAFLDNVRPEGGAPVVYGDKVEADEMTVGDAAALGQSMALTYRYEWGAQFSLDDSARIIVPVTPAGALELFKDRDKPEDRNRRAALRHWVSQHLRKKLGGDFSRVRQHLRGSTAFQWRGFDVVLHPSQYDQEKNLQGSS